MRTRDGENLEWDKQDKKIILTIDIPIKKANKERDRLNKALESCQIEEADERSSESKQN